MRWRCLLRRHARPPGLDPGIVAAMAKRLNMTGTRSSSCIADAGGQLDLNFSLSLLRHRRGKQLFMAIHCHVICIVVVALAKWDDLLDPLGRTDLHLRV
jgi:hypothetical protein